MRPLLCLETTQYEWYELRPASSSAYPLHSTLLPLRRRCPLTKKTILSSTYFVQAGPSNQMCNDNSIRTVPGPDNAVIPSRPPNARRRARAGPAAAATDHTESDGTL